MVVVDDFMCGTCGKVFPAGWRARDQHCDALGHQPPAFECDTCPRYFRTEHARYQHMEACGHFVVEASEETHECGRSDCYQYSYCIDWDYDSDRDDHWNRNSYSDSDDYSRSDDYSDSDEESSYYDKHSYGFDYFGGMAYCEDIAYECDDCEEYFTSIESLAKHQRREHNYCNYCDRYFQSSNSLEQHLRSSAHIDARIACPACRCDFTTATGLVHHIERRACPVALDHGFGDRLDGIIGPKAKAYLIDFLLRIDGGLRKPVYWENIGVSQDIWRCSICAIFCKKTEFDSKGALLDHIRSPAREYSDCRRLADPSRSAEGRADVKTRKIASLVRIASATKLSRPLEVPSTTLRASHVVSASLSRFKKP